MAAPSSTARASVRDPLAGIVDRLTDEFAGQVDPVAVLRCVEAARSAVDLFGEDAATMPALVERIAREDLHVLVTGQESLARLKPMNRARAADS